MIIEFNEVSKSFKKGFWGYKHKVLKNLSFNVCEGELCGFLGINGAGKSTCLKILLEFIRQDSGVCNLNLPGKTLSDKLSFIGYLPENPMLLKSFTGIETLKYLSGFYPKFKFIEKDVVKIASELNIDYALNERLSTYSKGMLQRISFLTSIIHNPKVLILDEPFSGLDPIGRMEMKMILKRLNYSGTTVLFTSHIVSDLESISSNIVVLKNGRNSYSGKLSKLIDKYSVGEKLIYIDNKYQLNNKNICNNIVIEENTNIIRVANKNFDNVLKELVNSNVIIKKIEDNIKSLEKIIYDI